MKYFILREMVSERYKDYGGGMIFNSVNYIFPPWEHLRKDPDVISLGPLIANEINNEIEGRMIVDVVLVRSKYIKGYDIICLVV